jgi:hypothetical protein
MEKTTIREAQWPVSLAKYYSGVRTKTNEMGGVCSTYGREEKFKQGSGGET